MRVHWRQIISLAVLIVLGSACGCVSSKQEARKQATAHWQQVRTGVTLQMAQQQLEKGQAERARESLQEVLRGNPNDPQAHLLLARVQFEMRDLSGAQEELSRARRLAPELAEVDYWQGVLAQASGEPAEAHAAYQAACSKAQDSAAYFCALLEAKLAMGEAEEALVVATARLRDFPRDVRLRMLAAGAAAQQGDLTTAERLYEQALDLSPSNEECQEGLAQVLYLAGQYERAGRLLEGLSRRGERKDLRLMLGACHLACGRYEKALRLYEACLAEEPDRTAARLRLNEARLLSGQASRARDDLQALVQRRPGEPEGWELLGHALVLEGEFPQARRAYVRAVECGGSAEELREYIAAIDGRPVGTATAGARGQGSGASISHGDGEVHRRGAEGAGENKNAIIAREDHASAR
jgi:Tfp pilus assembly protein PilF